MCKRIFFLFCFILLLVSCASTNNHFSDKAYDYYDGINKLITEISYQLAEKSTKLKIAILPILNENGDRTLLGDNISSLLQIGMFERNKQITIVERERIDSISEEIVFALKGNINETAVYKIGNMLSVNAVLIGTLRNEKNFYSIYLRLVDIEKGNIIAISQVLINKNQNIDNQFESSVNYSGGYYLHLMDASIAEKDVTGISWDAFSRADVLFQIEVDGMRKYESKIYSDFPKIDLDEQIELVLDNNNIISIILFDSDLTTNQKIGQINISPDDIRYLLRNNKKSFSSGCIKELVIELIKK